MHCYDLHRLTEQRTIQDLSFTDMYLSSQISGFSVREWIDQLIELDRIRFDKALRYMESVLIYGLTPVILGHLREQISPTPKSMVTDLTGHPLGQDLCNSQIWPTCLPSSPTPDSADTVCTLYHTGFCRRRRHFLLIFRFGRHCLSFWATPRSTRYVRCFCHSQKRPTASAVFAIF